MGDAKKDFVIPILVLTVICIVTSAALAFTQGATAPIIKAAEEKAAEEAKMEVLPGAGGFEEIPLENMPEGITGAFKADNGCVFLVTVKGYGGKMNLIVGIDNEGKIVNTKTLSHSETAGLGAKTAEPKFQSQFKGKDESLEGVSTIGGATISSKAFISGMEKAFAAAKEAK
ncbi:MAG: FMN-binding protein [Oscillospiraceae bacterium]